MLKSVKGIGLKTAQRIIVDLRDKIIQAGIANELYVNTSSNNLNVDTAVKDEAISALTMLGFSPVSSSKVVIEVLTKDANLPVEQVVKQALKIIK